MSVPYSPLVNSNASGVLVIPTEHYLASLRNYLVAAAAHEEAIPWDPDCTSNDAVLRDSIANLARGKWAPVDSDAASSTHYFWYIIDDEIRGRCALRTEIRGSFGESHGNIGYDVHADFRGQGIATEMLRSLLDKARSLGMTHVLITCDISNVASRRVIEKCGGVMRDTFEETYLRFDVNL